jgi:hypothetical protein
MHNPLVKKSTIQHKRLIEIEFPWLVTLYPQGYALRLGMVFGAAIARH